jgi:hypothetical protein
LASVGNRSKFSRFYAGTLRRFIGVRPAELSAKVMMVPEPVRPSWVQGVAELP